MRIRGRKKRTSGFSLIEIIAALAVMSLGVPAIAYMYITALVVDTDSNSRSLGQFLANSLMNEISTRRFYESSTQKGNVAEAGEVTAGSYSRTAFNDIDDYNQFKLNWGYVTPPRDESGTAIDGYTGYEQHVEVFNIAAPGISGGNPTVRTLASVADGTTDFKLVTVTIRWNGGRNQTSMSKVFVLP